MAKFQKGVSGNPGGRRRRDQPTIDLLAEIGRQLAVVDPEGRLSRGAKLVQALIAEGCGGNVRAVMAILDRVHGPVVPTKEAGIDLVEVAMEVRRRIEAKEKADDGTL